MTVDVERGSTMSAEALPPVACCQPLDAPRLSDEDARATAAVFKALADPQRVRIVNLLAAGGRALCVCDFTEALDISQPTVSHHMKKLLDAGLVDRERRGTWAYYSLRGDALVRLAAVTDLKGARP
jgi:ArsR family transcriptional regulator, arsenate/arsenite/antimonite-responsive transcriptional repressor